MIGPKKPPTRPVPKRWTKNSPVSTAIVSGMTSSFRSGETTSRPSIADSTLIAGVIMPSP